MATIKISDLAPVTNVADSEMSYIELTEQELKSVVGGLRYYPSSDGGGSGSTKRSESWWDDIKWVILHPYGQSGHYGQSGL